MEKYNYRKLTPAEEKKYFQYWRDKITGPEKKRVGKKFRKKLTILAKNGKSENKILPEK